MPRKLPDYHFKSVIAGVLTKKRISTEFPNIFRFITEEVISTRSLAFAKIMLISVLSAMILWQIAIQSVALQKNIAAAQTLESERQKITGEIVYWKNLSTQYKGYRDIYFRIATLEYKLGNKAESLKYLQKVAELDPNFDAGRVLGAKIKAGE